MPDIRKSIAALLVICLLGCQAFAGGKLSDWGNIQRIKAGTEVWVETKHGYRYDGKLRSVTNDSMTLESGFGVGGRLLEIQRQDIAVVRARAMSKFGAMALGIGIGAGSGAAIGGIVDATSVSKEDPGLATVLFTFLGTIVGVGAGGYLSKRVKKVYVAP